MSKLVVLAVIVAGVWYLFRMLAGPPPPKKSAPPPPPARESRPRAKAIEAEDMVRCSVCGTYVTADARSCGRADCPYGR